MSRASAKYADEANVIPQIKVGSEIEVSMVGIVEELDGGSILIRFEP